jgi:hypothetical protein
MSSRRTLRPGGIGGGLTEPVPQDIWALLAIVLGTFSLRFFASTAWLPTLMQLSPAVWQRGFLWQLVTYAFVGGGASGLWLLVSLLILYMFAGDVRRRLGRRGFWRLLLAAVAVGGATAVAVQLLVNWVAGTPGLGPFPILQGERILLAVLIAAFATLAGDAVIYLFFVLPIRAAWFLGLEVLFAFLAFLSTRDLAGMLGVWAAVGYTWAALRGGRGRPALRELWLKAQERWFRLRLRQMKRKRGFEVLPGGKGGGDDWLH